MTSLSHFGKMTTYIKDDESKSFKDWKGPKWESPIKTANDWLKSRRSENADETLWRVHDKYYDLNKFAALHPGGEEWISLTRGTDISEAFESHHITMAARTLLPKYYVKDAETSRNSPFTFKNNGFYSKLRERVMEALKGVRRGPTAQSKMFADTYAALTLILSALSAAYDSYLLAAASAICLCCTTVIAHNFFHQRNNLRMYYFSISGFSVKGWRISHGLSHHMFPNSRQDLEITMFEPFLQWTPRSDKTFITRFVSWVYSPIVYCFLFHSQWIARLMLSPEGLVDLIPFVLPGSMLLLGGANLTRTIFWWNTVLMMGSFCFSLVGLNAAHHHPEILHDGDEPRDEKEMDWGIYQIDAVRDRVEIYGVFPLVIVLFGDHTLHHLFPTIDHAHLHSLYPILEETCTEFGIQFKLGSIWDLILGQFMQLARNYTISFKSKTNMNVIS